MTASRTLALSLIAALAAGPAFAQDEDLLAPLPAKGPKKPPAKKPPAKKPPAPAKPPTAAKPPPVAKPPAGGDDVELPALVPQKGELAVKLTQPVKRARLFVDDKEVSGFPAGAQTLSTGEHSVKVKAPGHATYSKTVNVQAGKTVDLSVSLEATAAILSVTTDVAGAEVLLNGKSLGNAPVENVEVPPGNATITVRKEGSKDATQEVKLVAGREYPLSVKLQAATTSLVAVGDRPENTSLTPVDDLGASTGATDTTTLSESAPIYKTWYFWAGVVVVAAAVAVGTGVAVSSSQGPKKLTQNDICGATPCDYCIGCDAAIIRW